MHEPKFAMLSRPAPNTFSYDALDNGKSGLKTACGSEGE